MQFLRRTSEYLSHHLSGRRSPAELVEMSYVDACINFIYRILSWEDPTTTWISFLVLNFIYLIIIYYQLRFYCCLFSSALVFLVLDFYGEKYNIKEQPRTVSQKQISDAVKKVYRYLCVLRVENQPTFYGILIGTFVVLSFIGRSVSGQVLVYQLMLLCFFGPYAIHLIPTEYKVRLMKVFRQMQNSEGMVAETELIPFLVSTDERDADLDSLLTDRTQDSITNSLITGISSMPSHLDADYNMDSLQEDDLLPRLRTSTRGAAIEYSSDSDSESRNMEFDSAHFNRDSSSDEEHNYTKGLTFQDVVDKPIQNLGSTLLSNFALIGSAFVSNVLQTTTSQPNTVSAAKQDSDSDFEIINTEDTEDS